MSQKDESEVLDELFGASEDEKEHRKSRKNSEKINYEESGSEEEEFFESEIEEKKNIRKPKKRTDESNEESVEVDGTLICFLNFFFWFSDKILEARKDFEEALSKLKGGRRKREADSDSVVIYQIHEQSHNVYSFFRTMMILPLPLSIKCMML